MGAGNRIGTGLSYRSAKLHRLPEFIPLESILGLLKSKKIRAQEGRVQRSVIKYSVKSQ
jgi:hypothetical protein